jgi:hypothetical protein
MKRDSVFVRPILGVTRSHAIAVLLHKLNDHFASEKYKNILVSSVDLHPNFVDGRKRFS